LQAKRKCNFLRNNPEWVRFTEYCALPPMVRRMVVCGGTTATHHHLPQRQSGMQHQMEYANPIWSLPTFYNLKIISLPRP
jgi:hypothetical protein